MADRACEDERDAALRGIAERGVLTRGVEPPRVSPYGPELYASAIPPRERLRRAACKLPVASLTASANQRSRFFRARDSTARALRFLPNDRRRSA